MFENSKWIWLDAKKYKSYQESAYTFFCEKKNYCVATFVKKVSVKKKIKSQQTAVSADCKYILKLNGKTVSRGPAAVGGDYGNEIPLGYRFYDCPEITFSEGENVILAHVLLQPTCESDYSDGHGGFVFESRITYCDGSEEIISSDESWIAYKDNRFVDNYVTDLSATSDYTSHAKAVKKIWNIDNKNIPELSSTSVYPVRYRNYCVESGKTVKIDFGKVYCGYLNLDLVVSSNKKCKITLEFFEREGYPITFRDSGKETIYAEEGKYVFENLHLRSARYVTVTVEEGNIFFSARWDFVTYPVQNRGYFRCSDERLNRIYDVCVRTTQLCMNTYHMDSPIHQEAIGCTGDYLIQSLINYYSFGDYKLTRLDLVRDARYFRLKQGHRLHTAYGMIWVQWLYDYVLYSGDTSVYSETLDALEILMNRYESYLENGIVTHSHNFWFIDWSMPNGLTFSPDEVKIFCQASLSAFTYNGFVVAAKIMRANGKNELADKYSKISAEIKTAFNRTFWDNEKQLYFGGLENDNSVGRKYFGVHENILAVLFNITDKDPVSIMEKVVNDKSLTQAQPYFLHYELQALAATGLFNKYATDIIRTYIPLLDECDSGLKEMWHDGDYSHAWSGTPGYILPRYILGLYPVEVGYSDYRFEPNLCDLEWAEGRIPTPNGVFEIKITKSGKSITFFKEEKL